MFRYANHGRFALSLLFALYLLDIGACAMCLWDFVRFEYQTLGLPQDRFGLSAEQRLRWAEATEHYLQRGDNMVELGSLRFFDGTTAFSQRERAHLWDTHRLLVRAHLIFYIGTALITLGGTLAAIKRARRLFWSVLKIGSCMACCIIAVLALSLLLDFRILFNAFHTLFFKSSSWIFYDTDTLLRLFPLRFWRDAFLCYFAIILAFGSAVSLVSRKLSGGTHFENEASCK